MGAQRAVIVKQCRLNGIRDVERGELSPFLRRSRGEVTGALPLKASPSKGMEVLAQLFAKALSVV